MDEEKLRKQFTQAFKKSWLKRVETAVSNSDIPYIISLLDEISDRLSRLTPKSKEKSKKNIDSEVDLVLIKQMLENNAFDANEFYKVVDVYLGQIEELQAPADNVKLQEVKDKINSLNSTQTWGEAVAIALLDIHTLIDLIEQRIRETVNDQNMVAILKNYAELKAKNMRK